MTEKPNYVDYRVAVQKKEGDPVYVITVRENDRTQLFSFIARIYEVPAYTDLAHLDIHCVHNDGSVEVVYESGDWPAHAKTVRSEGFVVRGKSKAVLEVPGKSGDMPLVTTAAKPKAEAKIESKQAVIAGMRYIPRARYTTIKLEV